MRMLIVQSYLEHYNGIAADDDHPYPDLLTACLLFQCVVEDNVQVDLRYVNPAVVAHLYMCAYIISSQDAHDLAAAIELDENSLLQVLPQISC